MSGKEDPAQAHEGALPDVAPTNEQLKAHWEQLAETLSKSLPSNSYLPTTMPFPMPFPNVGLSTKVGCSKGDLTGLTVSGHDPSPVL